MAIGVYVRSNPYIELPARDERCVLMSRFNHPTNNFLGLLCRRRDIKAVIQYERSHAVIVLHLGQRAFREAYS